jgi:formate C-acetyltransferase
MTVDRRLGSRLQAIRARVMAASPADDPGTDAVRAESYAETAGEPTVIRHAKATAHYFRNRAIAIHPGELIVGTTAPTEPPAPPAEVAEPVAYHVWPDVPPLSQRYLDAKMMRRAGNHQTIDYETLLSAGLGGLVERIDERLLALEAGPPEPRHFLRALRIVAEGAIDLCRRYAGLAGDLAAACDDPRRARELRAIAGNCRQVIAQPPRSFWQACQAAWFGFLLVPDSPGRVDQVLYPRYRREIAAGSLAPDFAEELLCCLWAKYQEHLGAGERRTGNHHLVLGGLKRDGTDATNELSTLCLEVSEKMALSRPQVGVRWHAGTPGEFLERAVGVLRAGMGYPDFCSDEQIVPALVEAGVAREDALDFSLSGCHEVMITGKSQMGSVEGMVNLPKILRVALGLEPDIAAGGDPAAMRSYDDLRQAVVAAMRDTVAAMHEYSEYLDANRALAYPLLESSLLTQGCIESARSVRQGGARYNFCNWDAIGIGDLADALCAIRRLVFEEGRFTLSQFAAIVRDNWAGHEAARLEALAGDAHFGNDNDEVDAIAADIVRTLAGLLKSHTPFRGGAYTLGTLGGYENAHTEFGAATGATPDGRRADEPFAGSLGPAAGRDRRGVTAMLNSVAKIPHNLLPTSTTVNVMLDPSLLGSREGVSRIAALIEGHFRSGGQQCQFTFADRKTLLRAREDPASFSNIMVRVAGYSAPFVDLDEATQDEILARTQHGL